MQEIDANQFTQRMIKMKPAARACNRTERVVLRYTAEADVWNRDELSCCLQTYQFKRSVECNVRRVCNSRARLGAAEIKDQDLPNFALAAAMHRLLASPAWESHFSAATL